MIFLVLLLFGDSFEGKTEKPAPEPLICYYQTGWPNNRIADAPGNCVDIYQATRPALIAAVNEASRQGYRVLLDARSPHWTAVVDNPAVVAVVALDEPDLKGHAHRHRWDQFETQLLTIRQFTQKPIFCNFSGNANALNKNRALPARIPEACTWLGVTPPYGSLGLGPINELLAFGRPVLLVVDAYNGWDIICGNSLNCQGWKANKAKRMLKLMRENRQIVGLHVFLKGRPVGDTGCGTDCMPWLKERLIEMGIY